MCLGTVHLEPLGFAQGLETPVLRLWDSGVCALFCAATAG